MPTQEEVPGIVAEVRQRLADVAKQGVQLEVTGEKLEDDWLYVVVAPARPGVRASDHARLMSQIERELRQEGMGQVLLVPALEEMIIHPDTFCGPEPACPRLSGPALWSG